MKTTVTPQKRDKSLIPLSREHHFGLLFCWKIRQGLKNGTQLRVLRAYVQYFWKNLLQPHCAEEEWLLARLLPQDHEVRLRLEEEHRLLQKLIDLIQEGSPLNRDLFKVLDRDLTDHIRWEERDLFPYLQTLVPAEELELAGKLLAHNHAPREDAFSPDFWNTKTTAA
ncbi:MULTISPECIES: hemerythrin domain-containing protein [Rufibacter]|uniref:Hemerythrin superfamily protein n=1 Tax=Rufibacter quisquiliarum TaxID=1549639 RepID=A0A839GBK8_9BACT|nr:MULTISPECIES: hemerythrin domain-containing protein [Rufibacter]MBA9075690.1 hemerythrin superfamily protein [Rufibacter quisquiliarum]